VVGQTAFGEGENEDGAHLVSEYPGFIGNACIAGTHLF